MLKNSKVACITGASRGLGYAVAYKLAQNGVDIAICSYSEAIFDAKKKICQDFTGVEVLACRCNMAIPSEIRKFYQQIKEKWHRLDICINNVGFLKTATLDEMDDALWQKTMDLNVGSCFFSSQEAFKLMIKNAKQSCIVNISSLAGIKGVEKFPCMSAYIASKYAVVGLTEALALEGKEYNIAVNCVAPGAVNTSMLQSNFPDFITQTQPEEIADIVIGFTTVGAKKLFSGTVFEVYSN